MATIVELEVRRPARRSLDPARRSKSAEVVIFPGVRYEHWIEAKPPQRPRQKPVVVRDTLKIGD